MRDCRPARIDSKTPNPRLPPTLQRALLPEGYPRTVTEDYLQFQVRPEEPVLASPAAPLLCPAL